MYPPLSLDNDENICSYTESTSMHTVSSQTLLRRCGFPECQKTAKRGGLCIAHGGGKKCSVEGCVTSVVSRGCCVAHGGGKRCQAPACAKSAQSGGFCWIHGGGKKCGFLGCKKRAQSGGACILHGGGKRCRVEGCDKVVQYDGLCISHGGYRKCLSIKCDKRVQVDSYCQAHSGSSRFRVVRYHAQTIRSDVGSDRKAQIPRHTSQANKAFTHCRPSINLVETLLTVELNKLSRPHLPRLLDNTPVDLNAAMPCNNLSTIDERLPAMDQTCELPLQSVQRNFTSVLPSEKTMITPISKHAMADGSNHTERQCLPVLPSFQTLQRFCSASLWSERSKTE
ncbi:unnamed protein product [Peronospora belbahrii]|uniref:WRKY19-like zinc finger domain-containing protein n=1 Tax=Peronospora belbahrii TaxID=622444 RepID=A0AAU9L6G7_9STRA|nr:unnamed protein product [Peronospora belbahrii]CAH0516971.1 unnamed protein product [Peronospora belbahrii]